MPPSAFQEGQHMAYYMQIHNIISLHGSVLETLLVNRSEGPCFPLILELT